MDVAMKVFILFSLFQSFSVVLVPHYKHCIATRGSLCNRHSMHVLEHTLFAQLARSRSTHTEQAVTTQTLRIQHLHHDVTQPL